MPAGSDPPDAAALLFRRATRDDLPAIVAMLADDPLGARRESDTSPLPRCYHDAFDAIDRDPNIELVVAQAGAGGALGALGIVGVLQLSFIPNLSHRGGWRALIEGVRVAAARAVDPDGELVLLLGRGPADAAVGHRARAAAGLPHGAAHVGQVAHRRHPFL